MARHAGAGAVLAVLVGALLAGCAPHAIVSRDPVIRTTQVIAPEAPPGARQTGSLWRDNVAANFLYTDDKARFPGDLVTVVVIEDASGTKEADTSTSTESDVSGSLDQFFGFPQALQANNPDIDPSALVAAKAARQFDGKGSTSRKGQLKARVAAQVTAVAANGNLWIEGEKVVNVNNEDQHIVISGWARPQDISTQNEVLSTKLADARIAYYGVGVVGTKQTPGWGGALLDLMWPF